MGYSTRFGGFWKDERLIWDFLFRIYGDLAELNPKTQEISNTEFPRQNTEVEQPTTFLHPSKFQTFLLYKNSYTLR